MSNTAFTDTQKQFLSGFTMGSDVARAVKGLPVLAGSAPGPTGTSVSIGGGPATVDGKVIPPGPERIAYEAQAETKAAGKKLCKEEQAKEEKNPLDMWDEIAARAGAGEYPKGTDVFLTKWHGLFYVAPAQDSYMMRLRIPGGVIRSWQLTGLADLSQRVAGGNVDVTTRANLQIRQIPATAAEEMLYGVRELDIVSLGSGGDNIRNCTASTLSGIDETEVAETIPLAKRMHHYILNHRELYGLPRKFNIAFDGGGRIASLEDTNDIGFRAVRLDQPLGDTPPGNYFLLTLGGITGHKDFARSTGVLLDPGQCVDVAGAILRVFVKTGDRTDRKKSRLKYVLDDMGFDSFLKLVEESYGSPLRRVGTEKLPLGRDEDRLAHVDWHPQKQPGKYYVGVVLPVGRMTGDQTRGLARIAEQFGTGELRLTVWQNLIIPHIREADLEAVSAAILACGLDYRATTIRAGLVACTGSAGCKFGQADTKANAMELAEYLESRFDLDQPINLHLTGCHNSCAQHYIGDIGMQGVQVERGDDMVDGYHIAIGGGWGDRQGIGRVLFESVPFDEVMPLVGSLVEGYLEKRTGGEAFVDFARRCNDEELKALAYATA